MKRSITIIFLIMCINCVYPQDIPTSIQLKDVNSNTLSLDSVIANHAATILFFWALWAAKERSPLYTVRDVYAAWQKELNLEFLAISEDDSRNTTRIKSFTEGSQLPFPIILDPNNDLKRRLNFSQIPYCIIINQKGEIVYLKTGYLPGDEYEWEDQVKKLAFQKK